MSVNYIIAAEVVDARHDFPSNSDTFFVDSNVWYWLTYTKASLVDGYAAKRRSADYSSFLYKAISQKAQLCRCGLSLAELAHIIERSERKIFSKTHHKEVKTKEFRHNYSQERSSIVSEVAAAWGQVKTMTSPLNLLLNDGVTDAALNRFTKDSLDGYDLFFLEVMTENKVPQLITDDGDFATISGVRVFTANQNVITAAQKQGKLLTR